jgi:uncharacterized protein
MSADPSSATDQTDQPADQPIDPDGCRQLLAAARFGRLAVVAGSEPLIVVLNHVCDGADIVLRTGEGTQLARLTREGRQIPAVFEVDSAFPTDRHGWSVIAHGSLAREVDHSRATRLGPLVNPWAGGEKDVVLRLRTDQLTGRRVGPAE